MRASRTSGSEERDAETEQGGASEALAKGMVGNR
jgi:hypothetical protein